MAKVFNYFTGLQMAETYELFDFDAIPERVLRSVGELSESDWDLCSLSIRIAEEIWFDLPDGSEMATRFEEFIDKVDARMINSANGGRDSLPKACLPKWSDRLKQIRIESI